MTSLHERMKRYEGIEADRRLIPTLPAIARIDGKAFHTYTRDLMRPYDVRLRRMMEETALYLVEATNARIGYTQSDEITLIFYSSSFDSQIYFDGRIAKLTGVLASMATAVFAALVPDYLPHKRDELALFDCRVWNVPSQEEAANVLIWREQDATRNSIFSLGQKYYSHELLKGRSPKSIQGLLLFDQNVNWNDYPEPFKRGTYFQRTTRTYRFTPEELENLPPKHDARQNPEMEYERNIVRRLSMPPITQVTNLIDVVFNGADPE